MPVRCRCRRLWPPCLQAADAACPAGCALQVPLETLSSELHSHLDALKNKLVEVGAALAGPPSCARRPARLCSPLLGAVPSCARTLCLRIHPG